MESLISLPSPRLFPTPSPSQPKTLTPTIPSPPHHHHHHHHHHLLRSRRIPTPATTILRSHGLSSAAPSTAIFDASDPFGIGSGDDANKFDWYAQWYPLAPLCDLDKRAPHAKTVMGLDVVVWWDRAEGRWQVFDDRCPHRLAPLSEGRIDPRGRLQCVYHGWCFDGSGSCKYIPQAPSSGPQERKIAKAGFSNWFKACYVPTKSDAMVIAFRNWLRKYSNNQVDWGNMSSEQLPPTPPREQLMDRYWSHVVQCSSCRGGLKVLKALEFSLQVLSLALIGTVAAARHSLTSATARNFVVFAAVLCFAASRWLSHFIYKTFYFHDYNHAFK